MKINIHIYPSTITNESRIFKITNTLRKECIFDKIYIFGIGKTSLQEIETLDEVREIVRLPLKLNDKVNNKWFANIFKFFYYIQWSLNIIKKLKKYKINCVNCHSVAVLPLCVFLKITKKANLIYDIHELETETVGLKRFKKYVIQLLEKLLISYVDGTFVVSESIAMWYRSRYDLNKVWTIRNIPEQIENINIEKFPLRKTFNIPENTLVFIYQGVIARGRGINIILESFAAVGSKAHVIFMGYGNMVELVRENEKKYCNIHYLPAVPYDQLHNYTAAADVGLSIIENVCLSYQMCLPNKIFEYINCGIPIIISRLPEMEKIVDKYDCGWKCSESKYELQKIISSLTKEKISEKSKNTELVRKNINWTIEEKNLLDGYRELGLN